MPTTPNFAIPYPCEGDVITPATFQAYAMAVEAAFAAVNATSNSVRHTANAYGIGEAVTGPGAEVIANYTTFASVSGASGITLNAAAGTFTIITPGLYLATSYMFSNQVTLTMTSQRAAFYVNGTLQTAKKFRGTNPAGFGANGGAWASDLYLLAGDVLTLRYIWTGTGVQSNPGQVGITLQLLATP